MRLAIACLVAAASGFIALSYEILWVRVYSFATEGPPDAFGLLLTAYLTGIAVGALLAGLLCRRAPLGEARPLRIAGAIYLPASLLAFLVIPAFARLVSALGLGEGWTGVEPGSALPLFGLAAAGLGVCFPLLSHFAIPADERAGFRLSRLYVANIVGSTLGSLATGLWLLDVLPLARLNAGLAIAGVTLGAVLVIAVASSTRARLWVAAAAAAVAVVIAWSTPALHERLYERLMYKTRFTPAVRFAQTFEGRAGVVNLTHGGAVYGNGSYDGQTNLSPLPELDDNRVLRAYLVPAFHAHPRQILMVGLGAGAWLQVLASLDEVERITVVEINPGYVEMMRYTPALVSALANPKIEIVIDDGRRYLGHTERQFDVIIQNTIVYWRAYAASLLSREYNELSRRHLAPGGVLYFNATYSAAAQRTGALSFPFALRYQNMIIASDSPIAIDRERFDQKLDHWEIDGVRVLPAGMTAAGLDLLRERRWRGVSTWEDRASILRRTEGEPVITDDNMANEWRDLTTFP